MASYHRVNLLTTLQIGRVLQELHEQGFVSKIASKNEAITLHPLRGFGEEGESGWMAVYKRQNSVPEKDQIVQSGADY